MTAFAHCHRQFDWGSVTWEIRSVNQRYLECQYKLPERWRLLETELRQRVGRVARRGKIECILHITATAAASGVTINEPVARSILQCAEQLRALDTTITGVDPLQLLQWPGVLELPAEDTAGMQRDLMAGFDSALQSLIENREREGEAMAAHIARRIHGIRAIIADVQAQLPAILQEQHAKLLQRLATLTATLSDERSQTEIALLAQKADIAEELDRLSTHCNAVESILLQGGACGRKLDFLMQELNREANTLSSKSAAAATTAAAVELKVLIEQMREQIQNLE